MDFSWFYFIGTAKLGLSVKETGRLSLYMFNKLWKHYKDTWDMEMRLTQANVTYADAWMRQQAEEEWF